MLKKLSIITLSAMLIVTAQLTLAAQEIETASQSQLLQVTLPSGGQRILPGSVPAEINQTLDKVISAGNGNFQKGATEVLVWTGSSYKKANAGVTVSRLNNSLKTSGWQYETGGTKDDVTVFSAVRENPRRAVIGFYGATDEALVIAMTEVFATSGAQANAQKITGANSPEQESDAPGGSLVGTWTNGAMGMLGEKYQNGTVAARRGTSFKYIFHSNGTFEFTGYAESTMYGCATSLFQDKRGSYRIDDSQITLKLTKNFWRKQNACAPSSNSEQNYKLDPENYNLQMRTDEYGKKLVCLSNANGETCYRREN